MHSRRMLIRLHRLRDRGWPSPRYQFALRRQSWVSLRCHEMRDPVLNRHTRVASLWTLTSGELLSVPALLDTVLVGLTREVLSLSGIERVEDPLNLRVEDFAQTWLCWLDARDSRSSQGIPQGYGYPNGLTPFFKRKMRNRVLLTTKSHRT